MSLKHNCILVEGSISHQHILEHLAVPGMMILGADSHTCQAGCCLHLLLELEVQKLLAVWATGQLWLKLQTIKINLSGTFGKGVFARDLILDYIGKVGEDGANYKALEWKFSNENVTLSNNSLWIQELCISNAPMECGAKKSQYSHSTRLQLNI